MITAYERANQVLPSIYVKRWFNASGFFNTKHTTPIHKKNYFITHDQFMGLDIYALRFINSQNGTIDTIVSGTENECLEALKKL